MFSIKPARAPPARAPDTCTPNTRPSARALFAIIPAPAPNTCASTRRAPTILRPQNTRAPNTSPLFFLLALLAFLAPLPARAQSYYYTGRNPATPAVNDAASAIACDGDSIGAIRYNTGTGAFEGCNGTTWADIRNGATGTAAGSDRQIQIVLFI